LRNLFLAYFRSNISAGDSSRLGLGQRHETNEQNNNFEEAAEDGEKRRIIDKFRNGQ